MNDISSLAAELLIAMQLAFGQMPLEPPRTLAVDKGELKRMACADRLARSCPVLAWYAPDGTVYIDNTLDLRRDVFAQSILVHELIHHVQRMETGRAAADCAEWRDRENEAYAMQIRWLQNRGWKTGSLRRRFPFVHCR